MAFFKIQAGMFGFLKILGWVLVDSMFFETRADCFRVHPEAVDF